MATVMIDSNVLLDLCHRGSRFWFRWSEAAIQNAADTSRLVINAVISPRFSVGYGRIEDMDAALVDKPAGTRRRYRTKPLSSPARRLPPIGGEAA